MSRDQTHLSPFGSELEDFALVAGMRDSIVNMTTSDIHGPLDPIAASTVMRPTGGHRDNNDIRGSFMETSNWRAPSGLGNDSSDVDDFIRSHRLSGMLQEVDMSGLSIGSIVHNPGPADVTGSSEHTLDATTSSLGIIHLDSVHDLSGSLVHVEDPVRTPMREEPLDRTLTPDPPGHQTSPPPFDAMRGRGAGEDVHIPSHPQSAFCPVYDSENRRISDGSELGSNTTDMSIFSHRDSSILPLDNFDLLEEELDRMNQTQDEEEGDHDFIRQTGDVRNRAADSAPQITSSPRHNGESTGLRRLSSGDGEEGLSAATAGTGPAPNITRDDHLSAVHYQPAEMVPQGTRGPATGKDSAEESEIDTEDELEAVRREMAARGEYLTKGLDRVGVGESGESNGNGKASSRPELLGQNSEGVSPLDSMRQSAEGDVVTSPVPGDGGGGGDGSSGNSSDDNRPVQIAGGQVTLDVLRGLGLMAAPQARRPSQGSTRDETDTPVLPEPIRESIPGHEEVERMGPVGSGNADAPDVRGVHFASMDEYRQISQNSSLSSHSQLQQESGDGWEHENHQVSGQMTNADQTSMLASKFFLPTSRPSVDSVMSESTAAPWTHDASSFHLSELHASGRDRTSMEQEDPNDTLVGVEKDFGDGEEEQQEDLVGLQNVENPFDVGEHLDWKTAGDFGLEDGAPKGLDNPFGAFASSLGSFGLEQGGGEHGGISDVTFSQKVSFGEGEFSQLMPGSPRSSAGDRSNSSHAAAEISTSQQADGGPDFSHVVVTKCKQLAGEDDEPSPVYLNEKGQGVTDLAFHPDGDNPFDDMAQDGLQEEFGEKDFMAGEEAKDMLAEDEAKFEKDNIFSQKDNMATPAAGSVGLGEWALPSGSQFVVVQDSFSGEEPFMRISIGTFIGQRTEALGALGEEGETERPHFGRTIVTPPSNRMPVALIRLSEVSQDQGPKIVELLEDGDVTAAGHAGKGAQEKEDREDLDSTIRFSGVGDYAPEHDDSLYLHNDTLTPGYHPDEETPHPRSQPRIKLVNDDTIVIETTQEAVRETPGVSADKLRGHRGGEKNTPVSHGPKTKGGVGHAPDSDQVKTAVEAEQRRSQQARKEGGGEQKPHITKPTTDKAKDKKHTTIAEPDSTKHNCVPVHKAEVTADETSFSNKTIDASFAGPNISSIASAIVNASVSDDPTKLADMILKLSEKTGKGKDKKKVPKQAPTVTAVGTEQHKLPGGQVPRGQEDIPRERKHMKTSIGKAAGVDYRLSEKNRASSSINKVVEEKDTAKEFPSKKQPGPVGLAMDKSNEGVSMMLDTSKAGSPTKYKSRIPIKQKDSSKTKSPAKVASLDRSENSVDDVGKRLQKLDISHSVDSSVGATGKKGNRSYNLGGDDTVKQIGESRKDKRAEKTATTDVSVSFDDSILGITGESRQGSNRLGKHSATKELHKAKDSRLKVDHKVGLKVQDDSVHSETDKDKWETIESLHRTREHSPSRKSAINSLTQRTSTKDKTAPSGQESVPNNLSFSINSNYDVDIQYNFDVEKDHVSGEGWPPRHKDKAPSSKALFRERSPIRDRSPLKSPRRSPSPSFDTAKEHGHAKRDIWHGKNTRRERKPDHGPDIQNDRRKSSTDKGLAVPKKQKMPSDAKFRAKTTGFEFETSVPNVKPKKQVRLDKCILPGIEIEPEPALAKKLDTSPQEVQKSSAKTEVEVERDRNEHPRKAQPSGIKETKTDNVPEKDFHRSDKTVKKPDVSLNQLSGVSTSNDDLLSPKAEDLELHLKMANMRTRADKTSPSRSTSVGAAVSPPRPPVSPNRDSIASVHSTIQPSASSTPQSPSSPGKPRSRFSADFSQTFGDSTTFNFSPDDSALSPTLSHISPTPGRTMPSGGSVQGTPGETLHTRVSSGSLGVTSVDSPATSRASSPGRPMITPFHAYPQTSSTVPTTGTTPTLLTSRSLFTNPVAVQYLQSRPLSGMGGHTTTAASGIQQPFTYPPQSAPGYPGMYPPTSSLPPGVAYPPNIQPYPAQPYAEGMAGSALLPPTQYQAHPGMHMSYGVVPPVGMGIPGPPPASLQAAVQSVPGVPSSIGMMREDPQQGMMRPPVATSSTRTSGPRVSTTPTEDAGYRVIAPAEVRFPGVCCVGIGIPALLPLHNPTSRWLQCALQLLSINANGEQQASTGSDIFHLKQKTIIGPHTTEEIKVIFTPHHPGVYIAKVQVSSCLVLANSEDAAVIDNMPSVVNIQAIAEKPFVQVTAGEAGLLNFGDLPGSTTVCLPVKLTNHTRASVPVRLILSSSSAMWHCFSFKDTRRDSGCSAARRSHPLPDNNTVYHCTLQAKSDQQVPEPAIVMVQFRAPDKQHNTSGVLGPPDEYSGRVDIEMDTPGPTSVIASVPMKARVGVARIHAPRTLQALVLTTSVGTTISRSVPLKNAGNIPVKVDLTVTKAQEVFTLLPSTLTLHPGQQSEVTVQFAPKNAPDMVNSLMTMCVRPAGPQYEVLLRGESVVLEKKPSAAADAPPVLSNKQFLSWGGVPMGRALQQKLVLRNSSQIQTLKLDLTIRDDSNGCFQLQSSFMEHEQLSSSRQVILKPLEDFPVHLIFAPTRVATMQAKLVIKPPKGNTKFTIPLSGYGGTSNLTVEGLRAVSDMYIANLGEISVGKKSTIDIPVRNTGSRSAFVKAMCFGDLSARMQLPANRVRIEPSEFVLRERTTRVISVVFHTSEKEAAICAERADTIGTLGLFYGDEISRKQLRRALRKGASERGVLADTNPLKGVNFDMDYLGEEHAQEVYDLPERPNDIKLFYSCMSRVMISLVGKPLLSDTEERRRSSSVDGSVVERMAGQRRPAEPQQNRTNSPPVKGTSIPRAFVNDKPKTDGEVQTAPSSTSWSVQPEQLMLLAPDTGGQSDTGQVQILNHTDRDLSFELSWPGHCLTVTPQHGKVEARGHQVILVSPNPATQGKADIFPWRGNLFIHCDNGQKAVKIQIREDLALETSTYTSGHAQLQPLVTQEATPHVPATSQHKDNSPTPDISVSTKLLKFPPTRKGETAESCLDFRNVSEKEMKWVLSSFAPAYVKGVDDTNDIFRATYTVFRFARISGTLGATERIQIPVTFIPREVGSYSQFWDLQTELKGLSGGSTQTTRIQLIAQGKGGDDSSDDGLPRNQQRSRKISGNNLSSTSSRSSGSDSAKNGLVVPCDKYVFPVTVVDQTSTEKVLIKNDCATSVSVKFVSPKAPFKVNHHKYTLKGKYYVQLPVHFKPTQPGKYESLLVIQSEIKGTFAVQLVGEATR